MGQLTRVTSRIQTFQIPSFFRYSRLCDLPPSAPRGSRTSCRNCVPSWPIEGELRLIIWVVMLCDVLIKINGDSEWINSQLMGGSVRHAQHSTFLHLDIFLTSTHSFCLVSLSFWVTATMPKPEATHPIPTSVASFIFYAYFVGIVALFGVVAVSILPKTDKTRIFEQRPFLFLRCALGALISTWFCEIISSG